MIAYDELVEALANWRTRKGLAVTGGANPRVQTAPSAERDEDTNVHAAIPEGDFDRGTGEIDAADLDVIDEADPIEE